MQEIVDTTELAGTSQLEHMLEFHAHFAEPMIAGALAADDSPWHSASRFVRFFVPA
jgi:hypothetical protein